MNKVPLGVVFLVAGFGVAAADDTGRAEYMESCAVCHGESGTGDGPLAQYITLNVPDLTMIQANNDGVFPMLNVIHTIDGRMSASAHGGPMPTWGDRYTEDAAGAGEYGSEAIVRSRILSLAYYLETIQK